MSLNLTIGNVAAMVPAQKGSHQEFVAIIDEWIAANIPQPGQGGEVRASDFQRAAVEVNQKYRDLMLFRAALRTAQQTFIRRANEAGDNKTGRPWLSYSEKTGLVKVGRHS